MLANEIRKILRRNCSILALGLFIVAAAGSSPARAAGDPHLAVEIYGFDHGSAQKMALKDTHGYQLGAQNFVALYGTGTLKFDEFDVQLDPCTFPGTSTNIPTTETRCGLLAFKDGDNHVKGQTTSTLHYTLTSADTPPQVSQAAVDLDVLKEGAGTPTPKAEDSSTDDAIHKAFAAALKQAAPNDEKWRKNQGTDPRTVYDSDRAILFFDDKGKPASPLPQVDEDDTIVIVVGPTTDTKLDLQITKCTAAPTVRIGGGITPGGPVTPKAAVITPEATYLVAAASNCSSDGGLEATLKSDANTPVTISVPTLALYRITVGLAFIYDWTRDVQYRAAAAKAENTPVIVQDDHASGLGAVAFASLRLKKVDSVRARTKFCEIVSPAVGFSLSNPTDHLYFGLAAEPWPGFAFVAGYHHLQRSVLAGGFSVGDRVPSGTVPVDKRWADGGPNIFAGIIVDSNVLAGLIKAVGR